MSFAFFVKPSSGFSFGTYKGWTGHHPVFGASGIIDSRNLSSCTSFDTRPCIHSLQFHAGKWSLFDTKIRLVDRSAQMPLSEQDWILLYIRPCNDNDCTGKTEETTRVDQVDSWISVDGNQSQTIRPAENWYEALMLQPSLVLRTTEVLAKPTAHVLWVRHMR